MRLDDGQDKVKSMMGSLCSLFLLLTTAMYAYLKWEVLIDRKDTNVVSTTKDLFFTD